LQRFRKDESGVHLAEVAIVLPIFLVLFAGVAEFGRFFYEYTTLAKGTRVGARYLVTAQVKPSEDAIARNIIVYGNPAGTGSPILDGLSTSNVVIDRQGGVPVLPETVRVQILGFKHQPIFDLGLMTNTSSLSLNIDVKPSVTMRYLLTQPPPIE
jgi:Flp pilus assembly protein TadG